ncbi:MAG: DUF4147 domain-containing protein [Myxococcales bacterium]|nr:DUF4147 domain-containing protein [Myxococcales bacterium]
MATALAEHARDRIANGLVIAPEGQAAAVPGMSVRETAHPTPDLRCERAAREALGLAAAARPDDVFVLLLSGGASSLMTVPAEGLAMDEVAHTADLLMAAGAEIDELNAVRKHLSAISGGRLARALRCGRVEALVLSDVPGDRLDVIGSGPVTADPSTYAIALTTLERRGVIGETPRDIVAHLEAGARGDVEETVKPGDPTLHRVRTTLVATNGTARAAALASAERRGLDCVDLGELLAGEAREAGRELVERVCKDRPRGETCWVAGGETAVTLRGAGRGGRSQELALAAALALQGTADITLLAVGTDGRDGPTDAAGAFADGGSVARGRERGVDALAALAINDSHAFFAAEGGLLVTGATGTNVMDLVLVESS